MPELKLEQILADKSLRELYSLESREEFYARVESSISVLSLDCKPYDITNEMVDCVWEIVRGEACGARNRAVELYNWNLRNIRKELSSMGVGFRSYSFKSASETFSIRSGACVDFAFLYTAMARVAGFESYFVNVNKDYKGRTFAHACSGIYLADSKDLILVDPVNGGFDVKHRRFNVLSDNEVRRYWEEYCLSWNSGNIDGYLSAADRFCIGVDETSSSSNYPVSGPTRSSNYPVSRNRARDIAIASAFMLAALVVGRGLGNLFDGNLLDYFRTDASSNLIVQKEVSEDSVRDDRKRRFEYMVDVLKREFSGDDNLNYAWYPDDFLYVSRKYIEYKKRNLKFED